MSEPTENVRAYETLLKLPREEVTLYELEHPTYATDSEFILIMGLWERERSAWSRVHKEACPRPKRRLGRPKADRTEKAPTGTATRRKYAATVNIGLTDELFSAIGSVRGDLSVEECIRQLLQHALGPISQPPVSDGA